MGNNIKKSWRVKVGADHKSYAFKGCTDLTRVACSDCVLAGYLWPFGTQIGGMKDQSHKF